MSSWRTSNLLLSIHLASNPRFGTITLMTPLLFGSMDNCIFRSFCHTSMIYIRTWKLKTTKKYLFWTSQWRGKITLLPSRFITHTDKYLHYRSYGYNTECGAIYIGETVNIGFPNSHKRAVRKADPLNAIAFTHFVICVFH